MTSTVPQQPRMNAAAKAELITGLNEITSVVTAVRDNAHTPVVVFCRRPWANMTILFVPIKLVDKVSSALQAIWDALDCYTMEHVLLTDAGGLRLKRSVYTGDVKATVDTFVSLGSWVEVGTGTPEDDYLQFYPADNAPVKIYDKSNPAFASATLIGLSTVEWD